MATSRAFTQGDKRAYAVVLSSVDEFCNEEAEDPNLELTDDIGHGAFCYLWPQVQQCPKLTDKMRKLGKQGPGIFASKRVLDAIDRYNAVRGAVGASQFNGNGVAIDRSEDRRNDEMDRSIKPCYDNNPGPYPDPQWDTMMTQTNGLPGWKIHEQALTNFAW